MQPGLKPDTSFDCSESNMNRAPHNESTPGFRSRILKNTLASYISIIADLLIALLLIPFMIGHLGDADYGLWILVSAVVAYDSLLDFGIASAITKYVAEYRVLGRSKKILMTTCSISYHIDRHCSRRPYVCTALRILR